MATKKSSSETKITRISAEGSGPKATKEPRVKSKEASVKKPKQPREKRASGRRNPLRAMGEYFAGSWYELREVRWPNRRSTWGMVGALLGFTAFFVVVILLLDALFQWIFNLLLGS